MQVLDYFLPTRCLICDFPGGQRICSCCYPKLVNSQIPRCEVCYAPWESLAGEVVCLRCRLQPSVIQARRYLWEYQAVSRDFLLTMKYRPSRYLCHFAAEQLNQQIANLMTGYAWDYKIAVPSDRRMLWKRGFNQVLLLIKNLPGKDISSLMRRRSWRPPQAVLNHQQRRQNVANVFHFQGSLAGSKILLVDDMVTTGATVESVAKELLQAQAAAIYLLSLSTKY